MLEKVLQILQDQALHGIQQVFYDYNKVATGKTVDSIKIARTVGETKYQFDISIGGGYEYIVQGRSEGAPPPPNKELSDWARAVGFSGSIPTLAFFISKVGIEAVDLETPIEQAIKRTVESTDFTDAFKEYLIDKFQAQINNIK